MKTTDLTGALLNLWVARAQGIPAEQLSVRGVPRTDLSICVRSWPVDPASRLGEHLQVLDYCGNWGHGGPLVEKYSVTLDPPMVTGTAYWSAMTLKSGDKGGTPLIAICRAIVRAAFGDEVEDLPCV